MGRTKQNLQTDCSNINCEYRKKCSEQETEMDDFKKKIDKLNREKDELNEIIKKGGLGSDVELKDKLQKISILEKEKSIVEDVCDKVKSEMELLSLNYEKLKSEYVKLKEEYESISTKYDLDEDYQKRKKELKNLFVEFEKRQFEVKKLEEKSDKIKKVIDERQAEFVGVNQAIVESVPKIKALRFERLELIKEISKLKAEIGKFKNKEGKRWLF